MRMEKVPMMRTAFESGAAVGMREATALLRRVLMVGLM